MAVWILKVSDQISRFTGSIEKGSWGKLEPGLVLDFRPRTCISDPDKRCPPERLRIVGHVALPDALLLVPVKSDAPWRSFLDECHEPVSDIVESDGLLL